MILGRAIRFTPAMQAQALADRLTPLIDRRAAELDMLIGIRNTLDEVGPHMTEQDESYLRDASASLRKAGMAVDYTQTLRHLSAAYMRRELREQTIIYGPPRRSLARGSTPLKRR